MVFIRADTVFDNKYLTPFKAAIIKKYKEMPVKNSVPVTKAPPVVEEKAPAVVEVKADSLPENKIMPEEKYTETLADVIKAMEAEFDNVTVIKQTLYIYKQSNPAFFKQQVPLLPNDIRKKYSAVFQ